MQISHLVYNAHLLFIVCYNLDKAAHDVREKCNSAKHQENCNESFHVANGIVVTIAHSGECGECIVAADDKLAPIRNMLELEMSHESHFVFYVMRCVQIVRYHIPKTAYEVRNKERNDNEAEYPIHVHEHVYSNNSLFAL